METTKQIKDARFYQWSCEEDHKLTPKQKKIFEIAWIDDRLYIHAVITGMPPLQVMLCVMFDGTPYCFDGKDLFVPVDWVEEEYPQLRETMQCCRKKSERVRYDK